MVPTDRDLEPWAAKQVRVGPLHVSMYRNVHTQQTTVGPLCVEVRKLEVDTVRWGVWYAVRWGVGVCGTL